MKKFLWISSLLLFMGCSAEKVDRFVEVAEQGLSQTVLISTFIQDGKGGGISIGGPGVFISNYGHVLTCSHIFPKQVEEGATTVITHDGVMYHGELINRDRRRDLALIKIEDLTPNFAIVALPGTLEVGQEVIAIGHPFGHDFSVTNGIISQLGVDRFAYNMLQTNTAINPGNSGGPLYNLKGELVGINTLTYSPVPVPVDVGLSFAVEAGQIYEYIKKFRLQ